MSKLRDIIDLLASTSSTNEKQRILEANKENNDLRVLFKSTLDPMINFYLGGDKISVGSESLFSTGEKVELTADTISSIVDTLHGRVLTGHAARDFVQDIVDGLVDEDKDLVVRMLKRDLNCKVSTGLVDRVWKGMIEDYPCLLASKIDEKAIVRIRNWKDYFVQLKADGGRCNARVEKDGAVSFFSRNGNPLLMHGVLDKALQPASGYVLDGELLYRPNTEDENRQTGNGIFNKAVRGTISKEEASNFVFVVWDMIDIHKFDARYDDTPYEERFEKLTDLITNRISSTQLELIESFRTSDFEVAMSYFRKKVSEKKEGAMIKRADMPWEDKRTENMIKLKEVKRCELRCVGITPHSKHPNLIGGLLLETDDGKLHVGSGSGLTDEDRNKKPEDFIGHIFEIEYNGVIKAKSDKKPALFLPVVIQQRLDKTKTDKFEDL